MTKAIATFGVMLLVSACGGRSVPGSGTQNDPPPVSKVTPTPPTTPTPTPNPNPPSTPPSTPTDPDPPDPPPPPPSVPPVVEEVATCVFNGVTTMQACYSDTGEKCAGVGSCDVLMRGLYGRPVQWKSSCGGYASTILDGVNEKVVFRCGPQPPPPPPPPPLITEVVTCIFSNTSIENECYTAALGGQLSCRGIGSCQVKVTAQVGTKIEWKSTCGGYAYTVVDGADENAPFTCAP
ncbi:MAG: hypothetical protein KC503_11820 [Myxococcales bacterium]|nr:hypothetical protein [Myxococcales bacterium]